MKRDGRRPNAAGSIGEEAPYWAGTGHFSPLDGVRGIAILLVLVVHFFSLLTPHSRFDRVFFAVTGGGWAGVDLFFVLSGFLITGILLDTRESAQYYSRFYARRVLRIFPLYYAFLLAVGLLVGPLLIAVQARLPGFFGSSQAENLQLFHENQWWYYAYLTNVVKVIKGSASLALWTGPFWSLAVEEQFYLVWPVIVRRMTRERLLIAAISAVVLAFVIRWLFILLVPDATTAAVAAYVLTPSRMDALALGAIVAIALRDEALRQRLQRIAPLTAILAASVIASLGIMRSGFSLVDPLIETIGFSANAVLGAALITLSVTSARSGLLNRILSWRVLTILGAYSYCLYVIHTAYYFAVSRVFQHFGPPLVLGSEIPAGIVVFIASTAVLTGIGWVSWHAFEKRFLALKKHFPSDDRPPGVRALPESRHPALEKAV
jgi:peptidoglycan/LPS O-acetylase OafA/YrhL